MLPINLYKYLKSRIAGPGELRTNVISTSHGHFLPNPAPSVTIIIPTRDKYELLKACVESIIERTTYPNFTVLIIDNNSSEDKTIRYLEQLERRGNKVLKFPNAFNYAEICNFGASQTDSDYLCFLNNDTEVVSSEWLSALVSHATQAGIGVVGSKLLYPDGNIQHLGVALGYKGVAGHIYANCSTEDTPVSNLNGICFETSAVTFACALTSRGFFDRLGGLDINFRVGLNDVDFCLRAEQLGGKSVVCTQSVLVHHESATRSTWKSWPEFLTSAREVLRFLRKYDELWKMERYFSQIFTKRKPS